MQALVVVAALVAALDGDGAAPQPSATPLKEIYHAKASPFCTVFRQNVFRAVQGLMINDAVIAQGGNLIAKMTIEGGHDLAQYQLGQKVHEAASNLTKVYRLLEDPNDFPRDAGAGADRDLLLVKARLEAVADAQERSLNILSGTYETGMFNDLSLKGSDANEAISNGSPDEAVDKRATGSSKTSLGVATPPPQFASGFAATRWLTGQAENAVAPAVLPGIDRCK